ncbi:MAG TPA: hypothetical protein VIV14_05120, partial [Gammaproteobacteria bacterium]
MRFDRGRQNVTGNPEDGGEMRVPSLRNAGLRSRFMHTGEFRYLSEAITFYNNTPALPGQDEIPGIGSYSFSLTDYETSSLAAFIRGALTDPRVAEETFPFDRPTLNSEYQK